MRRVVLDTETTGLHARLGDRVIELGCVEVVNRRLSGNHFHRYVNPEREIEEGALRVHGITAEFLQDKPRFCEIAGEFVEFIRGAELVIHNAPFDVEFLDRELALAGIGAIGTHCSAVVDTLAMARQRHPGKRNSLDALCERYQVEHAHRTLHGALLDAELLAEVYLAMTRGQDSLAIDLEAPRAARPGSAAQACPRPALLVPRASEQELQQHERVLDGIARECPQGVLWRRVEPA